MREQKSQISLILQIRSQRYKFTTQINMSLNQNIMLVHLGILSPLVPFLGLVSLKSSCWWYQVLNFCAILSDHRMKCNIKTSSKGSYSVWDTELLFRNDGPKLPSHAARTCAEENFTASCTQKQSLSPDPHPRNQRTGTKPDGWLGSSKLLPNKLRKRIWGYF